MNTTNILHLDSSSRKADSTTRKASQALVNALINERSDSEIIYRDVSSGLPFIDEKWIEANFTDPESRTSAHKDVLAHSDSLVSELKSADILVIASPIYNFSIPASLKAWIDLIARARLTFQYTENGPKGLLENKKAYILIASGGVPVGSDYDFVSPYLRHVMGFIGIEDVTVIDVNQLDLSSQLTLADFNQQ